MQLTDLQLLWNEDVLKLSKRCLVIVVFREAKSQNVDAAISLARSALNYTQAKVGKETAHAAAFERTASSAARALSLLNLVTNWSSTQVFAGGRLQTRLGDVLATLACYQEAEHCETADAHCLVLRDGLFDDYRYRWMAQLAEDQQPWRKRFVVPCSLAHGRCSIVRDHPVEWGQQLQAIAVKKSTDWCPLFSMSKFRQYD